MTITTRHCAGGPWIAARLKGLNQLGDAQRQSGDGCSQVLAAHLRDGVGLTRARAQAGVPLRTAVIRFIY